MTHDLNSSVMNHVNITHNGYFHFVFEESQVPINYFLHVQTHLVLQSAIQ